MIRKQDSSREGIDKIHTVTGQDEAEAGILGHGADQGGHHIIRDHCPGLEEAGVSLAANAKTAGVSLAKVQVGDPVADGSAAPEGKHQELVGGVHGKEASHVAELGRAASSYQ